MNSIEVSWIQSLDSEKMIERCKATADYYLLKNSMQKLSINFESEIIPHLDVNRIITMTDKYKDLEYEKFVVNSITIPLSAGNMSIQATSANMLPINEDIEKGVG